MADDENNLHQWLSTILGEDDELLMADGLDDCLIGVARIFNKRIAVYDTSKVLAMLEAQGMTAEEAEEYFEFNIVGAFVGENTPAFMDVRPPDLSKLQ